MVSRWSDPFRELERFQNQVNRLLSEGQGFGREREGISSSWIPPVDIHETPEKLVFNVEVPGFKENELTLRAENGVFTVEGERKFEEEKKDKNYHRVERSYGRFTRSFTLPMNVSTENIKANLNDGVLMIEMPKREEAKPKTIPIGTAARQIKAGEPAREKVREPELVGANR